MQSLYDFNTKTIGLDGKYYIKNSNNKPVTGVCGYLFIHRQYELRCGFPIYDGLEFCVQCRRKVDKTIFTKA